MQAAASQNAPSPGRPDNSIAAAAPINGAVAKYAPARAAPSCRKATINCTRLNPYPRNPITTVATTCDSAGREAPNANASAVLVTPATSPLIAASTRASLAETLRVRLLSNAQHRHAATINDSAGRLWLVANRPGHTRIRPPPQIATNPSTTRELAGSLNTSHARTAVNTTSRFNSSEASAASARARPNMSSAGAMIPPMSVVSASQGQSRGVNPVGDQPRSWMTRSRLTPTPLPR